MAKAKYLNGKDLMLFVGGKAIALAKTCQLQLSGDTLDTDNKDCGIWAGTDIGSLSWQVSSEAVASVDEEVTAAVVYDDLFDLFVAGEPVSIIVGIPTNIAAGRNGVPEAGWTAPSDKGYTGKAIITSLELGGDKGSAGSVSVQLNGDGALEKLAGK